MFDRAVYWSSPGMNWVSWNKGQVFGRKLNQTRTKGRPSYISHFRMALDSWPTGVRMFPVTIFSTEGIPVLQVYVSVEYIEAS